MQLAGSACLLFTFYSQKFNAGCLSANQHLLKLSCELGRIPLHLFWRKLLLIFVGQVADLPRNRLVNKAYNIMQAQQSCKKERKSTPFGV